MVRDTLLTYQDFNKAFKIHINACAFQLGEVIIQKENLIFFTVDKLPMPNNGIQ